jgi:hypothetical protein
MNKKIMTKEDMYSALGVDSLENLSQEKIVEFVDLFPEMDHDLAVSEIEKLSDFHKGANGIIGQLNRNCDMILKSNEINIREAAAGYKRVLDALSDMMNTDITFDQKMIVSETMVTVADKLAELDDRNKAFLNKQSDKITDVVKLVLFIAAAFFGGGAVGYSIGKYNSGNDNVMKM